MMLLPKDFHKLLVQFFALLYPTQTSAYLCYYGDKKKRLLMNLVHQRKGQSYTHWDNSSEYNLCLKYWFLPKHLQQRINHHIYSTFSKKDIFLIWPYRYLQKNIFFTEGIEISVKVSLNIPRLSQEKVALLFLRL